MSSMASIRRLCKSAFAREKSCKLVTLPALLPPQEFVPWCERSMVMERQGDDYMEAELEVGFKVFVER